MLKEILKGGLVGKVGKTYGTYTLHMTVDNDRGPQSIEIHILKMQESFPDSPFSSRTSEKCSDELERKNDIRLSSGRRKTAGKRIFI